MSGHKMTANECEKINQIVSRTDITGNERAELIAEFAKQFALQVATEAVEEEKNKINSVKNNYMEHEKFLKLTSCNSILKNIKKRLNDE